MMSLDKIIKNINVDFYDEKYILVNAKQYDGNSRYINVTCYNQGKIFNLSSTKHTVYVRYEKADKNIVFDFCTITTTGQVLVELTEQMLASSGMCSVDLVVINKGDAIINVNTGEIITVENAEVVGTMKFNVYVYESAVDNSLIESSNEYTGLTKTLASVTANWEKVTNTSETWALTSQSWAVGNSGIEGRVSVEDTDNSKYYSQLSRSYAIGDADNIRTGEDEDNAKYYCNEANKSAGEANDSATSAANSETNAKTYMDNTFSYQNNAKTYMDNAKTSENNASTSESNAKVSELNAATSESNALVSENNAKASELNSATSELNALTSANKSQSYAVGGTGTRTGEDEDNAKYYCNEALASASNIQIDAEIISDAATLADDSAKNAANSAEAASASADIASDSATLASDSAKSASNSADTASTSATNASDSASEANAYYLQTKEIVTGLSGAFMPMGTIEYAELATLVENDEVEAGYLYNISDNFTTDDTFKRGSGVEYAAGTNVYRTSDGYWDCLTSTTVVGVKGDKETEYRQGEVNITVENIGAVSSDDIASVDEVKSYLGI